MPLLDLLYLLALAVLSPWLVWRRVTTGRYRRHRAAKLLGRVGVLRQPAGPRPVWFHAVSVGEVNLLGTLVPAFRRRRPDLPVIVSATTDTGLAEARRRFPDLPVIPFPFDFSWAVAAALDAVAPSLVVLTESELWPNFLRAARQRGVPVAVVNARISPRSFRRMRRAGGLVRRLLLDPVARFAVQDAEYAERLRLLGVPAGRIVVTGSVKYDGALREPASPPTRAWADLLGRDRPAEPGAPPPTVLLAGSTHAPEEAVVLAAFARLRERFPWLRLILVPRHPDRFEEVARLVEAAGLPLVRRSRVRERLPAMPPVLLWDTVGELGMAWGLADIGFVGGSLDGRRGGQSMIEPAGAGVPCVFGPHVWNFRDAATRLVEAGGAVMVPDAAALEIELARLIGDPQLRQRMGTAARELVRRQQGATVRTLAVLDALLPAPPCAHAA